MVRYIVFIVEKKSSKNKHVLENPSFKNSKDKDFNNQIIKQKNNILFLILFRIFLIIMAIAMLD